MTPEAVRRFNLPGDERNEMIIAGPVYRWDRDYNVTNEPVMLYGATDFNQSSLIGQLNIIADFEFDDASILSVGDANSPAATPENIANGTAFENIRKGARCWKYPPREEDYKLWNRQQANDTPIFRYADILLTKAECILRGATATLGATPVSLVNEVRDCASAWNPGAVTTLSASADSKTIGAQRTVTRFGTMQNILSSTGLNVLEQKIRIVV